MILRLHWLVSIRTAWISPCVRFDFTIMYELFLWQNFVLKPINVKMWRTLYKMYDEILQTFFQIAHLADSFVFLRFYFTVTLKIFGRKWSRTFFSIALLLLPLIFQTFKGLSSRHFHLDKCFESQFTLKNDPWDVPTLIES